MVGDMRTTFIAWLRRTESQLQDAKGELLREKEEFEGEKARVWKQFMTDKQKECVFFFERYFLYFQFIFYVYFFYLIEQNVGRPPIYIY